jgi:DNA-binding transcriptional ArsR family regulator
MSHDSAPDRPSAPDPTVAGWSPDLRQQARSAAASPPPAGPAADPAKQREQALKLLDDQIGERLREAERNGELRRAPSWGKPLTFGDGYDDTPAELRMPMKVLKDAGVVPPEIEGLHRLAALRRDTAAATDDATRRRLAQQASELEQLIKLRLERLRGGTL